MLMSDTEDYPGPTQDQPEKEGQDPRGRANEEMVKPPARPEPDREKEKESGEPHQDKVVSHDRLYKG
jgi:hypothetical protein